MSIPSFIKPFCQTHSQNSKRRLAFAFLLYITFSVPIQAQPDPSSASAIAKNRIDKLQTPVSDELLYELEKDFIELLKSSKHVDKLLQAETLLVATNDNTHWTNYSEATRILLAHRDSASIPLLLRYIVLHSKRSSHHIMIPEYQRAIEILSGKQFAKLYESGPDIEKRMRSKVQQIVNDWWRPNKSSLAVAPEQMQTEQLHVLVNRAMDTVRRNGDFSGSGGKRNTAYGAYHNVYYKALKSSSDNETVFKPLHPAMLPLFLAKGGYRSDQASSPPTEHEEFPYELVVILAEYAKNGHADLLHTILNDPSQCSNIRIVCALALVRASHEFPTDPMLAILEKESDLERKLICLLALRWASPQVNPVLLKYMEDHNLEIATAAACALADAKPKEAIPKFEKLLTRQHTESPILLLNALSEYQTEAAKALLKRLLTEAVDGTQNSQHLYRIISAFAQAWGIDRSKYDSDGRDYQRQSRLLLAIANDLEAKREAEEKRQLAIIENLQSQLQVAQEIETLRRREYKRLLMLQSDEIVSPQESQSAHTLLNASVAEVELLQSKLLEQQVKIDSNSSRLRGNDGNERFRKN
jgi:hypothetical protein